MRHFRQRACDVLARRLKGVGADINWHVRDIVRKAQSSFKQNAGFRGCASTQLNEAQWQRSAAVSASSDRICVSRQDLPERRLLFRRILSARYVLMHKNRGVKTRQLDDGISDALVSALEELGNGRWR